MVLLTSPLYDTGLQPSGLPWPEDDPARVATDNQIIESLVAPRPGHAHGATASPATAASPAHPDRGLFSGITSKGNVTVIDAGAWLSPGGHYSVSVDGVTARCGDGVHFTVAGGEWLAKRILPVISLLGRAHQAASPSGSWSGDDAVTPPSWYPNCPAPPPDPAREAAAPCPFARRGGDRIPCSDRSG